MKIFYTYWVLLYLTIALSFAQKQIIPLWPDKIPNQKVSNEIEIQNYSDILRIENVQKPTLEIYLPTKKNANGQAVIICPGGGYRVLAYDWEGIDIAKWFNSKGIAAFVLKYRLPGSTSIVTAHKAPLQDAQRAMKLVRHHAKQWNIDPDNIGIMGFSAGGHLASTLGTHYAEPIDFIGDSIDTLNARPDFMVLIYPVISMNPLYTHQGSKNNLLGKNPEQKLTDHYSNELQVNKNTPPTFLLHTSDDKAVSVMNSLLFYQALIEKDIDSEMHLYPKGGHGFALAIGQGTLQSWTDRLSDWLNGLNE